MNIYNQVCELVQFDIKGAQVQKIYSSSRYINFVCRKPGKTFSLFLGRGNHYEGIWLSELKLESSLRLRDQFLEYLRKYLVSTTIDSIELHEKDRIITINYFKSGKINKLGLFYKGRELYFYNHFYDANKNQTQTYLSWSNKKIINSFTQNPFEELDIDDLDKSKVNELISIENLLEEEKKEVLKSQKKSVKKIDRKVKNIESDLKKIKESQKIYDYLNEANDLSKLDKKSIIHGIRFNFKEKDHFKRRDQIYNKIKRLKEVLGFMEDRLNQTQKENKAQKNKDIISNTLKPIKPIIKKVEVKTNSLKTDLGYKLLNDEELVIGIGLSAKGNDQLRSSWAKKEDLWFHLDAQTSPHIIVKGDIVKVMDNIIKIAKIMKSEAGLNTNEVNLMYTQVKNLKGIKSKPGSVIHKKTKYIRISLD